MKDKFNICRVKKVQSELASNHLDALITFFLPNIYYLTGYTGSSGCCIITSNKIIFLTDFRYKEQVKKEVTADQIIIAQRNLIKSLINLPIFCKGNVIGFESVHESLFTLKNLKKVIPSVKWKATVKIIEKQRYFKDEKEIRLMRKAQLITSNVFLEILNIIKPGMREIELAAEIEYRLKITGSKTPSFTTIVASGKRSALPHGIASEKVIKNGEFLTMDFGATYREYCGDFTRTVVIGKATIKQKKIYNIVREAQTLGINASKPGIKAKELDKIARNHIIKEGYGKYFGHGLGHGIGIQIHEAPSVSKAGNDILDVGCIHTVEPGIYIPGFGGVRIEDVLLVTPNGHKNLTNAPKELLEI